MAKEESSVTDTVTTVEEVLEHGRAYLHEFAKANSGETDEPAETDEPVVLTRQNADEEEPDADTEALSQANPETEAETPPEEPEQQPEEPPKEEHKLDPKVQEAIDRRIGKEVAKAKAAKEQVEVLEARLAELEGKLNEVPNEPASIEASPLEQIHTVDALRKMQARAESAVEYGEDLLDNLDINPDIVEKTLKQNKILPQDEVADVGTMRKTLRDIIRNANRTIREVPKRESFLSQLDESKGRALKILPELKDEDGDARKLVATALKEMPFITKSAKWPELIATYIKGLSVEQPKPVVAKPKSKPASIPTPGKAPAATPGKKPTQVSDELRAKVFSGNADRDERIQYIQNAFLNS